MQASRAYSAARDGPLRIPRASLNRVLQGAPLFLLLAWTTKAFTPDLNPKSSLMARNLDMRLELVSSGAALWKQLLLPVFTVVCVLFIIRSRNLLRTYINVLIPLAMFAVFLLASFLWSDHPDDTLRRAIRQVLLFTSVAGVVVIARSQNRFVNYIQFFSVVLLVYEALFLLVPWISFDVYGKFTGLHPAKNEFGGVAGAFLLISLATFRFYAETINEKRLALFCTIGWAVLLVLSGSKTPMGFVVLLGPLMFLSQHFLRHVSLAVIAMWLLIIVFIPMALIGFGESPFEFYRGILPEDALTGRTGIWFHLLADLERNWMFGTAYGAYWGVGAVPEALDIKYSYYQLLHTAHSGFVDLCMELGVVPTVFWLVMLVVFIIVTRNASDPMSSALIAYALLHNCLETSFFTWVAFRLGDYGNSHAEHSVYVFAKAQPRCSLLEISGLASLTIPVSLLTGSSAREESIVTRSQSVLVIASSGGHLTQAICATSTVGNELVLVSNKDMLNGRHFERVYIVRDTQNNPIIHMMNFFTAVRIHLKEKPIAAFSTGGPICLPFALLAKLTRTKFVFLDTMSRVTELSNSGKLIRKFGLYDSFICQWKNVAEQYNGIEYYGQAFDLSDDGHQ